MNIRINEVRETGKTKIEKADDIFKIMKKHSKFDRETVFVLLIDADLKLISKEMHSIGTIDSCSVYMQ